MSKLKVCIDYPLLGTYIKGIEDYVRKINQLLDRAVLEEKEIEREVQTKGDSVL